MEYAAQSSKIDPVAADYLHHSQGQRTNTDVVIAHSLAQSHGSDNITIIGQASFDILAYAAAGHAKAVSLPDHHGAPLKWHTYVPPPSRVDGSSGNTRETILFGKYDITWKSHKFLVYIVDGRDGNSGYPQIKNAYIISPDKAVVNELILAVGLYASQLHGEIWLYDQGMWRKDAQLWSSIQHAKWENVILDASMKAALISDASRFFDTKSTYEHLGVPWKRGIIFHGPPGNGKTISIKATMHMLYDRREPVPTIYVKTLTNWRGPEASLNDIFAKARSEAPCYLVFEDLDSLVTDQVRSFFLNQVDGLSSNDGILMIGSTNHLDRLDPGISKRPSRFDRLYLFPNPDFDQRVLYAEFWRKKLLKNNKDSQGDSDFPDIEYPESMIHAVAEITNDFSFAYIQEAFVAALLQIAVGTETDYALPSKASLATVERTTNDNDADHDDDDDDDDDDDLNKYVLWREFKKQVKILHKQLGSQTISSAVASAVSSSNVPPPHHTQMATIRGYQQAVPIQAQ